MQIFPPIQAWSERIRSLEDLAILRSPLGAGGNLALIWQQMSADGADAHYVLYDPASGTWSKDVQLFHDAPVEHSFAPVWDDVGNLTVALNKVTIERTNKR